MHANYKAYISHGSKVIAKVKGDNRQDIQKQYAPDHSIMGMKLFYQYISKSLVASKIQLPELPKMSLTGDVHVHNLP